MSVCMSVCLSCLWRWCIVAKRLDRSGNIVLDGDPAPRPKKGDTPAPNLRSMYCGQTAGWNKMPLGMEVGLGPGHIVLGGDPPPTRKGHNTRSLFLAHVYCGQTVAYLSNCWALITFWHRIPVVCSCCVRFSIFSTKFRNWLVRTSQN